MKSDSILTTLIQRKVTECGCCFIKYVDCVLVISKVSSTDLCMVLTYRSLEDLEYTFTPIDSLTVENICGHTGITHIDFHDDIPALDVMLLLANSLLHDPRY